MIRYYGLYSNKMRGCARKGTGHSRSGGHLKSHLSDLQSLSPGSPPPPRKLPSRKWRDLIRQAWHVDPLQCPVCQKQMRVIAFIDNPEVVEKILRHLVVRPSLPRLVRHPSPIVSRTNQIFE